MPDPRRAVHVHKFGGASLADSAAVRHAVAILRHHQPEPTVVVVSAMAGVTDALLGMATDAGNGQGRAAAAAVARLRGRHGDVARGVLKPGRARTALLRVIGEAFDELDDLARGLLLLRELTPRTSDYLVARGERLSARLVAAALEQAGVRATYVDAVELVPTDGVFGGATPDLRRTDANVRRTLGALLRRGVVPVVPGFLGGAPSGEVATLGRGGSDLTATLLARALRARRVSLWKDVPGLLTADPRVVPDTRVIPQLHAREAAELAYYGAKVLHPRALIPLAGRRIPLRVRPFADPAAPGTEVSERAGSARFPVKALSAASAQALVTVAGSGMLGVPGIAARTFATLQHCGISVSLISQASSEHSICFTVPDDRADEARQGLLREFRHEIARREIDGVEVRRGMATVAVVGMGMAGTPGVAAGVFSAVSGAGLNVVAIAQGSSELNISLVLGAADAAEAQRRIHEAFRLSRIAGGAVARPERMDVVLLGFGQIGRALAPLIAQVNRPALSLRVAAVVDRSGFVFDPQGLGPRRLAALAAAKRAGLPLARAPRGRAATAEDAVRYLASHALTRPVLVDVTAEDTSAVLLRALEGGMDLVLANKRPLAGSRGASEALWSQAAAGGRRILHEATVGAGLPVIATFHKLVESGDRVHRIEGALSGTLGFVLSEMTAGASFSAAVRSAMARGYTEPDPREDLAGMDVGRKALILARLLGYTGELEAASVESLVPPALRRLPVGGFLERLETLDEPWRRRMADAAARGVLLRYVATATRRAVSVGLREVPRSSPLASIQGSDNQVVFTTARYRTNPLVITGPGAGAEVTAAGVLNDILALAGP